MQSALNAVRSFLNGLPEIPQADYSDQATIYLTLQALEDIQSSIFFLEGQLAREKRLLDIQIAAMQLEADNVYDTTLSQVTHNARDDFWQARQAAAKLSNFNLRMQMRPYLNQLLEVELLLSRLNSLNKIISNRTLSIQTIVKSRYI